MKPILAPRFSGLLPCTNETIERIKAAVAEEYHVTVKQIDSPCRKPEYVTPRYVAIHLASRLTGAPHKFIALRFNRERSTVAFALRTFRRSFTAYPKMKTQADAMAKELQEKLK